MGANARKDEMVCWVEKHLAKIKFARHRTNSRMGPSLELKEWIVGPISKEKELNGEKLGKCKKMYYLMRGRRNFKWEKLSGFSETMTFKNIFVEILNKK